MFSDILFINVPPIGHNSVIAQVIEFPSMKEGGRKGRKNL